MELARQRSEVQAPVESFSLTTVRLQLPARSSLEQLRRGAALRRERCVYHLGENLRNRFSHSGNLLRPDSSYLPWGEAVSRGLTTKLVTGCDRQLEPLF